LPEPRTIKRISLAFGLLGLLLMGVDLLITRNFFSHVAELMVASIACFIIALLLDRKAERRSRSD